MMLLRSGYCTAQSLRWKVAQIHASLTLLQILLSISPALLQTEQPIVALLLLFMLLSHLTTVLLSFLVMLPTLEQLVLVVLHFLRCWMLFSKMLPLTVLRLQWAVLALLLRLLLPHRVNSNGKEATRSAGLFRANGL